MKLSLCLCFTLLVVSLVNLGFSCGSAIISSALVVGGLNVVIWMWEPFCWQLLICCNKVQGLKSFLEQKLYGRPLAIFVICQHVEIHLLYENSSKTLLLTFHGELGVYKTFVSKAVAENTYEGGFRSRFHHLISAMRDFLNRGKLQVYQNQLRLRIEGNVSECDQSLFIIEEGDKLRVGLLDVLVPTVECRSRAHHFKFSKAIFILLSNTGSFNVTRATFDHSKSGKGRQTLNHSEMRV